MMTKHIPWFLVEKAFNLLDWLFILRYLLIVMSYLLLRFYCRNLSKRYLLLTFFLSSNLRNSFVGMFFNCQIFLGFLSEMSK